MPSTAIMIEARADIVWDLITDTHTWPGWGPSVRRVHCATRYIENDSQGTVETTVGARVPFKITKFEPGRSWSWRVAGVGATDHRVEPVENKTCRLIFAVPLWAAPYLVICRIALRRIKRLAEALPNLPT